jgi:hypothetical protein
MPAGRPVPWTGMITVERAHDGRQARREAGAARVLPSVRPNVHRGGAGGRGGISSGVSSGRYLRPPYELRDPAPVHPRESRRRAGREKRDDAVVLHPADLLGREERAEAAQLALSDGPTTRPRAARFGGDHLLGHPDPLRDVIPPSRYPRSGRRRGASSSPGSWLACCPYAARSWERACTSTAQEIRWERRATRKSGSSATGVRPASSRTRVTGDAGHRRGR